MGDTHSVRTYTGSNPAFYGRWICKCGVLMPRVPFGILLDRAFKDHLEGK